MNIITSILVTLINILVSIVSFLRGPIIVGLLVGVSIMVFASNAEAAIASYQCNHVACPVLDSMSFSEMFGLCSVLVGLMITLYLINTNSN